jgi:hypothetical protein
MLFTFGPFWKTLLIFICAWSLYGVTGFEFTVVTLMAAILANIFIRER